MLIKKELRKLANKRKAKVLQMFFKTGKGQYGEGDLFLGITVPKIRSIVKIFFVQVAFDEIQTLLDSKFHEERLLALLILVKKYEKADNKQKEIIVNFYLKNSKRINNWDLVDLSAPNILGDFLLNKDKDILYTFSKSNNLWERRISILSTFYFIRNNNFKDTLNLAKILLNDPHDLIHKATGWMLREIGKRDIATLEDFLEKNQAKMSRTTLRYAIERMPESKRRYYLSKQ